MRSNAPDEVGPRAIEIGLGIGSNIGDKPANIRKALALLESRDIVRLMRVSSIYKTPPWGYLDQENFANACALGTTTLAPEALLHAVKKIEMDMGRQETMRWGPRLIDIDILFYGSEPLTTPDLVLPHKELFNRAFVLVPLAEIAPKLILAGQSVAEAAAHSREPIEKWREGD